MLYAYTRVSHEDSLIGQSLEVQQADIIANILTDSQLDTHGACGKTLREYATIRQQLLTAFQP